MAKVHSLTKGIKADNQKTASLQENGDIKCQNKYYHYPMQDQRKVLFI